MNAVRNRWIVMIAALVLPAAVFPSVASADVLDTLSPWCIASYCEGYAGDPGATACADLAQEDCLSRQNCWWRDTTTQNALAESAATDFGGQLLHPYSGSFSGNAIDVWVWNGFEGTNVILVVAGSQYVQIGDGVSDVERDEALAAFQAGIPDFDMKTAYAYIYNTAVPGIDGSTWTSTSTIPIYVSQYWMTERNLRNLAATAHATRSAQVLGAGLAWGPDGFLGDGTLYGWDLSAPTSPQKPNSLAAATTTTTLQVNGLPVMMIPTGFEAGLTVYLPAQRVLIPGWPFGTHFPDIAPLDRAPLDPAIVNSHLNTCLSLNPYYVVPQYGPPVVGNPTSMAMLSAQRDAVTYVHTETLRRMNLGEDVDTVAATLALPSTLAVSPWNQQVTTTVAGVVRGIYALRLGWYGGVPADLAVKGLTPAEQAARLAGVGGTSALLKAAKSALDEKTDAGARWAAYLAHTVMVADPEGDALAAKCIYWNAVRRLAFATPSARERNLFLVEIGTLGDLATTCGADDDADNTPNWLDCSPRDAGVNPGASEVCDGKDNDCNGLVDDGIAPVGTACGTGACEATGIRTCVGGEMVDSCRPGTPAPEVCDSIDNDCDGQVDDGLTPATSTCGDGACASTGTRSCENGRWADTCLPVPPDDCGVCYGGNRDKGCDGICFSGVAWDVCNVCGGDGSSCLGCDGVPWSDKAFDDCDVCAGWNLDKGCDDVCFSGRVLDRCGVCGGDGIDATPTICGEGLCASTGIRSCVGPMVLQDTCLPRCLSPNCAVPTAGPGMVVNCLGADHGDACSLACDAASGYVGTPSSGTATCAYGEWSIDFAAVTGCVLAECGQPAATGYVFTCTGTTFGATCNVACSDGYLGSPAPVTCEFDQNWSTVSGCTQPEVCDGIDNDGNGLVDDGIAPAATTCGVGACRRTGTLSCMNGAPIDTCVPGAPATIDTTCNGIDDDCDGQTDEDYVPSKCGVGACASTNRCVAGVVQACVPGTPSAETLDGLDNDCDGIVDEGMACAANSQCATGFCVDGVCCTSACGGGLAGDCMACSVGAGAALDGTCGPAAKGTTCRAGAGACDIAETCDGVSTACSANAFKPASTVCRVAAGACDKSETCTGSSAACPADVLKPAGTVCRAAGGFCDITESCTGATTSCPADTFVRNGTLCGIGKTCQNGACKKR
jgi:hypothetical protein